MCSVSVQPRSCVPGPQAPQIVFWPLRRHASPRLRREVELPVYERLGDTRSAAIAWGQIADIAYRRRDFDEAAELQARPIRLARCSAIRSKPPPRSAGRTFVQQTNELLNPSR